jgi:hypothetical protein
MPHKDINVVCRNCRSEVHETVYYKTDEELVFETNKESSKFYGKIWGGVFIFGITLLLFIWSLVLMLKSFEMKKLERVLGDPGVQYEETWRSDDDPAKASTTTRAIKIPKGGVVTAPNVEALQKEVDLLKANASKAREGLSRNDTDIDNLIKTCAALREESSKLLKDVQDEKARSGGK